MERHKAYSNYKASGIQWIGSIPIGWTISRIKFIAEINPSKQELKNLARGSEVTFLPMEAIGEKGEIDTSATKSIEEVLSGYTFVGENDVMLAKITPCFENGKGALAQGLRNGIAFATTEVIPLRCIKHTNSKFLYYLLSSSPFRKIAEGAMYGAGGQKRVADGFVANYHFAQPSDTECELISNFLDQETAKIDTLIEKQQQLIKLLKEKRQAVISQAVTKGLNPDAPMKDSGIEWLGEVAAHWCVAKLRYLVYESAAGPYGASLTKAMYTTSGYRVYGQQQVIAGDFELGDYYISIEKYAEMERYTVYPDDVLITVMGTIGKVAVVPEDVEPGIINPRLVRYVFDKSRALPEFVKVQISSSLHQDYLLKAAQGSTMDGLNMGILGGVALVFPSPKEQQQILEHVAELSRKFNRLISSSEKSLALLEERRTALISAAVTGKIDVRNWQPEHVEYRMEASA